MNVKEKIGRFRKPTENEFRGGFEFFSDFSGSPHSDPHHTVSHTTGILDNDKSSHQCEKNSFHTRANSRGSVVTEKQRHKQEVVMVL
jgi:hypothetical protein